MKFSKTQLEALWISAGGKPGASAIAAAVALAESGGDSNSTNHNTDGSTDRGLWQINSVHGAQSTYSIPGNVRAAISISGNGGDWAPWTTYKTGAYRQFYNGPVAHDASLFNPGGVLKSVPGGGAIEELVKPGGANPLSGVLSLGKIPGDFDKIYHLLFTPEGWQRIGKVLLGVFLLLTGLLGMANISASPVDVIEGGKGAKSLAVAAGVI